MRKLTLGSLFDGSGGFPFAGSLCGIEPVWAAEVEPYPIAVTRSRFPNMKHLGSVTEVKGNEVEPVDVITFGSPCQDLSVAGKRAGLKHTENGDEETTRSGLFMEAIRIIKEMREATNGAYPRFAVWENVPGAFSSNKGEDFRIVLEEFIKIVEPTAVMPAVPKNGWPYADSYCGDGWSLAYRVFDAQFWGVPQRRRRIYLVADFRGQRAGKVSFEREGVRGYFTEGRAQGQGIAGDAENCVGTADCEGNDVIAVATQQGGAEITTNGICPTVTAAAGMSGNNQPWVCMEAAGFKAGQGAQARSIGWEEEKCPTLAAEAGGNSVPSVCVQYLFENHSQDSRYRGPLDVRPMLPAQLGTGGNNQPFVVSEEVIPINDKATRWKGGGSTRNHDGSGNGLGVGQPGDPFPTLTAGDRHAVAYSIGNGQLNQIPMSEICNTLDCMHDKQAVLIREATKPVRIEYLVRRLTPTECARLQGFADRWGDIDAKDDFTDEEYWFWLNVRNTHAEINGKATKEYTRDQMLTWYNKLHTDSSEYKMWGNGIALPCALYVMQGIADVLKDG